MVPAWVVPPLRAIGGRSCTHFAASSLFPLVFLCASPVPWLTPAANPWASSRVLGALRLSRRTRQHRRGRQSHGAHRRERGHSFGIEQRIAGDQRRRRARGSYFRNRVSLLLEKKSPQSACRGRYALAAYESDYSGAHPDLCSKGFADFHSRDSQDITYHGEYRVLPPGRPTVFILIPTPRRRSKKGGMSHATKMTFFILGAAGAGAAAWGIHDIIESHNGAESPSKP